MSKKSIHIIGGGIVGLCSAYFLEKEGFQVTVVDKSNLQDGTSHGNAGMIVPSHFVPLASPGVISQGLRWMFKADSPFFIRPRADIDLFRWLWRFYRSCNQENVNRSMSILHDYNEMSRELYRAFAQKDSFNFDYEKKGLLMLYKSKAQEDEESIHAEKASKLGVKAEILNQEEIGKLEPDIKVDARGGLYFPDDAHLYPNKFIAQLVTDLESKGVIILRNTELRLIGSSARKITSFTDDKGRKHQVDNILFSAGSWTAKILKLAGVNLLLQDGKGYSVTLENAPLRPQTPTILSESKVAVTPMGKDLRIGGTLEISNLSSKINKKRVAGILDAMPRYYPDFDLSKVRKSEIWHGFRPCSPDGLPYLGKLYQYDNATIATGHGMMGMSLGPATGQLISEIICAKKTEIDVSLFNVR